MNSTDVFFNNEQFNWDAVSVITNTILVLVLVFVTGWYAREVKKQTTFMKMDRVVKEMENLVAPLYSKMRGDDRDRFFVKNPPMDGVLPYGPIKPEYLRFWDEINRNRYLGEDYLRSAIDDHQNSRLTDTYEKARDKLFEAIKKRDSELRNDLLVLRKKI